LKETRETLEPARLAGRLRSAAAMPHGGVVPEMARRPVMRRQVGPYPRQRRHGFDLPGDDRLAGIDPDQSDRSGHRRLDQRWA
jgi:hypothetical protein